MRNAAWVNVGLHVAGLGLAAIGMRPGTPAVSLEERTRYLAASPLGWTLGWGMWMLCALALVVFMGLLAPRYKLGTLALVLGAAGAAVDLLCDTAQILVIPMLASGDRATFLAAERLVGAAGLIPANGLYSIAVLVVTLELPRGWVRWAGFGCFVAGMGMVVAGFLASPTLIEVATGPTILCYCAWTLGVASQPDEPRVP